VTSNPVTSTRPAVSRLSIVWRYTYSEDGTSVADAVESMNRWPPQYVSAERGSSEASA
jgi:hypothetical protein